jgi:hypothetical protein
VTKKTAAEMADERALHLEDEAKFNAAYSLANEGEAVCNTCGEVKPHAAFPHYAQANLMCKPCIDAKRNLASRDGVEAYRDKGAKVVAERIRQLIDLKKPLSNAPHITQYIDALIGRMGGVQQVVDRYVLQLEKAEHKNPGSKTVLDVYAFLGKMILYSTEHRATAPDVQAMTDGELRAERQRIQLEVLYQELLAAADPEQRATIEAVASKVKLAELPQEDAA